MPYHIKKLDRRYRFKNVHGNYSKPYQFKTRLFNNPDKKDFAAYNETTEDIQKLIGLCVKEKTRIRACGSRWSLSEAPYTDGFLISSVNMEDKPDMKFKGFLNNDYLEQPANNNEFLFAQCGNTIKDLNAYCVATQRSLKASGASNGQTIAGAMSTGVNGSAWKTGCIQDFVVGLHIVKGDQPEDAVYLEPANAPVANQQFVNRIKATIIRDDELFYSALVSLGSFGYIHGVMIQTVPLYKLHNTIKKVTVQDAYDFTKTQAIRNTPMELPDRPIEDLYHLKFYINQYNLNTRAEIMYEIPLGERGFGDLLQYGKDFLIKMGTAIVTLIDDLIPPLIDKLIPKDGSSEMGFLGDIFSDTTNARGGQFSCSIAVEAINAEQITRLMMAHFEKRGVKKIPSVFSYRFVPKSKAIMAFTKFDLNCIIGIDGLSNKHSISYLKEVTKILANSGVPHTWHWGKQNYMDATFVKKAYGPQLDTWRAKRAAFLTHEVGKAFSSDYVNDLGLTTIYP